MAPEAVEFSAADGTTIHADFYPVAQDKPRPLILLFHQAGSNAGEYAPIAPRLQALGYAALAIDQRSGGKMFGRVNRTVKARGSSTKFLPAYPDLKAALVWAQQRGHTKILAWGSSYTAALVFKLAAEHGDALAGILAFSPGEYMGASGTVAGWAKAVHVPLFVTSAPGEEATAAKKIVDAAGSPDKTQHVPKAGVHGSSTLHAKRNKAGHEAVWDAVAAFLRRVVP